MTYTLSIDSMLRQLYARGAMAWAGRTDSRPDILNPSHRGALCELLKGSFARMCLEMLRYVVSTNLDEVNPAADPFFVLELELPSSIDPSVLRASMEQAVAMRALTGALTGIDSSEAASVMREATAAMDRVAALTTLRSHLHLAPAWV